MLDYYQYLTKSEKRIILISVIFSLIIVIYFRVIQPMILSSQITSDEMNQLFGG